MTEPTYTAYGIAISGDTARPYPYWRVMQSGRIVGWFYSHREAEEFAAAYADELRATGLVGELVGDD